MGIKLLTSLNGTKTFFTVTALFRGSNLIVVLRLGDGLVEDV